ncbi:MAG: hypothetical protein ACR2NM_02085 [Bythopirellula sp.]
MSHAKSFSLLIASWCSVFFLVSTSLATEPNDSFGDATVLAAGTVAVSDTLAGDTGGPFPDTYLGFFADDTFSVPPLAEDDDSSPLGDGLADALFGIDVNPDGSIPLAVTGCCDDFDGSHFEEGDYELIVDVFDSTGAFIESVGALSTLLPGVVDEFPFADPAWIGGSFDASIDNTISAIPGTDPLDFWVFAGLTPGATYVAEIVDADFDTLLGEFDAGGALVATDDDGGVGLLSLLEVTADGSGEVYLAVTGYPDFGLVGLHFEAGSYDLSVTLIPEPSTLAGLLVVLVAIAPCARRV